MRHCPAPAGTLKEGGRPGWLLVPLPFGSWDLLCRLFPWRPASPEGMKEQSWALCPRGQRAKGHLHGQQPFLPDPTWLELSTAGICSSTGEGHLALKGLSSQFTPRESHHFDFCHTFSSGGPGEDPSGTRMPIHLETPQVLRQWALDSQGL